MILPTLTVRRLDIGEPQPHPLTVIDKALTVRSMHHARQSHARASEVHHYNDGRGNTWHPQDDIKMPFTLQQTHDAL